MDHIKTAAAELAAEQLHAQFPTAVTVAMARGYVTPALFVEWFGTELASRSALNIFTEVVERVAEADLRGAMCALILGYDERTGALLTPALINYVARDLAYAANCAIENFEPSDAQIERSYTPLDADRRALAHEVNSGLRAARMSP